MSKTVHLTSICTAYGLDRAVMCGHRYSKYERLSDNPEDVTCAECRVWMDFVLERGIAEVVSVSYFGAETRPSFNMDSKYLHVRVDPVKTATDAMLWQGFMLGRRHGKTQMMNDAVDALVYGMRNIPADEHVQETDPAGEDPRRS